MHYIINIPVISDHLWQSLVMVSAATTPFLSLLASSRLVIFVRSRRRPRGEAEVYDESRFKSREAAAFILSTFLYMFIHFQRFIDIF
jgi:transcription initiation factor IIE alpha subunit